MFLARQRDESHPRRLLGKLRIVDSDSRIEKDVRFGELYIGVGPKCAGNGHFIGGRWNLDDMDIDTF